MRDRTRLALIVGLVVALVALSLYRVPTTFNIAAQTQIVTITVGDTHRDLWFVHDASVLRGEAGTSGGGSGGIQGFTGAVRVLPGAVLNITRMGAGPLRVTCVAGHPEAPVAELRPSSGPPDIVRGRLVLLDIDPSRNADGEEQATVLPMSGRITVGAEVTDAISEYPVLLLEGSVTMLAHTLVGDMRYDAGRVSLDLGDYVKLDQAGDAFGLIVAGRTADLSAAFRVEARSLRVYRFGSAGYSFYASPFTRIQHDPAIQAVWGGAVFVFAVLARLGHRGKGRGKHAAV